MRYIAIAAVAALIGSSTLVDAAMCSSASGHRRHHSKATHKPKATSTVSGAPAPVASSSVGSGQNSSVSSSNSPNSSSNSSSDGASNLSGVSKNGIFFGMLPDEGDAGGSAETMSQLDSALGANAATYGWYAQAQSGTTFDGSQLLPHLDDIKSSGAIAEFAVMPTGGWQGLTSDDDSQAQAICAVMKKFTDEGIFVRLRFAHEVNYYQTDGTYTGTASDFKAGWATVANACKSNSMVDMWFTPNIANMQQYQEYFPSDPTTVDACGIDYYPQDAGASFTDAMQDFYNYCIQQNPNAYYAIGETGLGFSGSIEQRLQWLGTIMSAATHSAMPQFRSVSWFNYQKGEDFRVVTPGGDNSETKTFFGVS